MTVLEPLGPIRGCTADARPTLRSAFICKGIEQCESQAKSVTAVLP